MKRCPTCKQPIVREPARVCGDCREPIGAHHKYFFRGGRVYHRDCDNPTSYGSEAAESSNLTLEAAGR